MVTDKNREEGSLVKPRIPSQPLCPGLGPAQHLLALALLLPHQILSQS